MGGEVAMFGEANWTVSRNTHSRLQLGFISVDATVAEEVNGLEEGPDLGE